MEPNEFAKQLGINGIGTIEGNTYTVTIANSDEYSKVYTLLDTSELMHLDTDTVTLSAQSSKMTYISDDFNVILSADFDKDTYTVSIEKE
jgi:hypothetical protein